MVRKVITILFLLLIVKMYGQVPSEDNSKYRQTQAIVYEAWHWKHFRPRWYYWLFHNRYRKGQDRRYIKQTTPNYVTSYYQRTLVEREKDSVTKVHKFYLAQDLDAISGNRIKYNLLIKDDYNELMTKLRALKVQELIFESKAEFGTKFNIEYFNELARFKERHDLILDSYRPSAEKIKEFQDLLKEMKEFYKKSARLEERLKIALKNKKYLNNGYIGIND